MKVLFINKYDITGGAGVASFRLHQGLERFCSTTNSFVVGSKRSSDPRIAASRNAIGEFIERSLNVILNAVGLQYVVFPFSSRTIVRVAKRLRPDVISLHNIHGGYFNTSLLPRLSTIAPIVWTLHDMWAFTGSAAHTFGDLSWKMMQTGNDEALSFPRIGIDTGRWLLRRKKEIYANANLTIVTPSHWLHDLAVQAPVFKGKKVKHIFNGIDLNVFKPGQQEARVALGIPKDACCVMFTAEHLGKTQFKGGSILVEVLRILASRYDPLHIIMVGKGSLNGIAGVAGLVVHRYGYIKEEERLAQCYAAADVFVYPTKADNLPNSLIEASACATPSVTFDVGGCMEIIENNVSGYVVPPGKIEEFASRTMDLLDDVPKRRSFASQARHIAQQRFALERMSEEYFDLMSLLIEERNGATKGEVETPLQNEKK